MSNLQDSVFSFMEIGGQSCSRNKLDTAQTSLYIGLVLEEVQELLASQGIQVTDEEGINRSSPMLEKMYKQNQVNIIPDVELLDALIDIAWVALGAAYSLGADVAGAIDAVAQNNLTKFPECSKCDSVGGIADNNNCYVQDCSACNGMGFIVVRDSNGKIQKPEGYEKVSLKDYLPE